MSWSVRNSAAAIRDLPSQPWANEVSGVGLLKQILIRRDRHVLSGACLVPGGRRRLATALRPLFTQAARSAIDAGRWFDFQQLSLWAARIGLQPSELRPDHGYEPPPPMHGYRHLGYPVAVAMDVCDRSRGDTSNRPMIEELQRLLSLMERFGCAPQAWKIAYVILRRALWFLRYARTLVAQFRVCQYTLRRRLGWLIVGP